METRSDEEETPAPQYAEEILCASWNPLARMLAEPLSRTQSPVIEGVEVEASLARLYLCQRA